LRETSSIPNAASLLLPIFKNIKNPRYLEICRELKAQDTPNTFLDAYHLWTAETENCDFFLTTEGKIGKLYGNAPVRVVTPSELCNFDESLGWSSTIISGDKKWSPPPSAFMKS
jgi:hypothetical protein